MITIKLLVFLNSIFLIFVDQFLIEGKTYTISQQSVLPTSVVTTVCYAQYQNEPDFNFPSNHVSKKWLDLSHQRKEINEYAEKLKEKLHQVNLSYVRVYYFNYIHTNFLNFIKYYSKELEKDIENSIERVHKETRYNPQSNKYEDLIDNTQLNTDTDNDVGIIIENDEMIFETVNFKLNKHSQVNVVIDKNKIETKESELAVKILLGEPILINPNSFENVTEVFWKIGKEAGIKKYNGNLRDCLMIVCDGLPAVLGWNIIFNTLFCKKCQLSFNEVNKIKQHNTEIHKKETEDVFEFDWILLRLAYGHFLINSFKNCN